MMNNKSIPETIERVIRVQGDVDATRELLPTTTLYDDLHFDSLDIIEICMACEAEFDIDLPDEEMDEVKTVGELIALVEKHVSKS